MLIDLLFSQHIDDVVFMGPSVCGGITEFTFVYSDVSYNAHNSKSDICLAIVR